MSDGWTGAAAGAGGVFTVVVSALVWVVKKVIPAILKQNHDLISSALENMKANTRAIDANTRATEKAASAFDTFTKVSEVQATATAKQLDRIENKLERQ